MHNSRCEC